MPSRIVVLAATLIVLAGCTAKSGAPHGSPSQPTGSSEPSPVVAGALRRPLKIPTLESGSPCPVSEANPEVWSRRAPGLGPGPVAPVGLGTTGVLRYRPFAGSHWSGQKVLWVAAPGYLGPILIRGAQVDGAGGVGFNVSGGGPPLAELRFPAGGAGFATDRGYRNWPSYTRVRAPGCYAYQVDGANFSYVIIFRATPLG